MWKDLNLVEDFQTLFNWANVDFLTPERCALLRNFFGDLRTAWGKADLQSLQQAGIPAKSAGSFLKRKAEFAKNAGKALQTFERVGAKLLFFEHDDFPKRLLQIPSCPVFLFTLGEILPQDDLCFAVVGSRNLSANGKIAVEKIVPPLVHANLTIISGLARGVDAFAQKFALNAGGRTIGVLGSGIDRLWPAENAQLAKSIVAQNRGAIVSEFPIGTDPLAFNFPRRNRIVSGLSLGVLVVEGKAQSGSLITAQVALDQGREVFAIPGSPFFPLSGGPNKLIKSGEAKLVESAQDIFDEFEFEEIKSRFETQQQIPQDDNERIILQILADRPFMFDEIVKVAKLPAAQISSTLTILEMKGLVKNLSMGQWTAV